MDGDSLLGTDTAARGRKTTQWLDSNMTEGDVHVMEVGARLKWHEIQPHFLKSPQIAHIC